MMERMPERGPDRRGHWLKGNLALGHLMLETTPESTRERQPLLDESGDICLVLDGRIDNRAELRRDLESEGLPLRDDTDAELVLRSWQAWGRDGVRRLIGDFAFALWDGRLRILFCARDFLGIKPFYYHSGSTGFFFASELRPVAEASDLSFEPNEGMVGEYLAQKIVNKEETLLRGVLRLPPGHWLMVHADGSLEKQRYWEPDPGREIRYASDDEYAEHFLEVFREAVRCRLRSHRPIGAYLSGGLDSSSVTCMAHRLLAEGSTLGKGFETFSMIFPGRACDESAFIRVVLDHCGVASNTDEPRPQSPAFLENQVRRYLDFPDYPNGSMAHGLRAIARDKGIRALLTGWGGDEWLQGSTYHCADLLRSARLLSLFRSLRDSDRSASFLHWHILRKYALAPLVPEWLITTRRRLLDRIDGRRQQLAWIAPSFLRDIGLEKRVRESIDWHRFPTYAQSHVYAMGTTGWMHHIAEIEERASSSFGLEQRHPFQDRRLVELALALPEDQRHRDSLRKTILRNAMRGILPEKIRTRRTKVEFSEVRGEALDSFGPEIFQSMSVVSNGWVCAEEVQRMCARNEAGRSDGKMVYSLDSFPLWGILATELWVRHALRGGLRLREKGNKAMAKPIDPSDSLPAEERVVSNRRVFEPPKLVEYGSVEELTRGGQNTFDDGLSGMTGNKGGE